MEDTSQNTPEELISYDAYIQALNTVIRFQNQIAKRNDEIVEGNHLYKFIVDLYFSERVRKKCLELNVFQVKDLIEYSLNDLKSMKNLGTQSIREIVDTLSRFGLQLKQPS